MLQPLLLNVIGIPAAMYIVRSLGPTAYGQWAVAGSLVATTTFLTNLGLRMWFVRHIAQDPDRASSALAELLGLRLLLALIAAAVSLAACHALGYPLVVLQCTAVSSFGLVFMVFGSAIADVLQSLQRLPALAAVNMVSGLVLTATSVLVVWLKWGPAALAGAYALGPLTAAVLFTVLARRLGIPLRIRVDLRRFAELLMQVRSMGAQLLVENLALRAEALLVPKLVGVTQYGLFSAATMLGARLVVIPDGLSTAYYPIIASSYRADPREASREVAHYLLFTLLLSVPFVVLITFLAGPISAVLFADHARPCAELMRITIWSLPFLGASHVMGYSLNAAGKETIETRCTIAASIVSLALSVALIRHMGLIGAAWSWVAREAICVLFRGPWFIRTFATGKFHVPIGRLIIAGASMAALLEVLDLAQPIGSARHSGHLPSILNLLLIIGVKVSVGIVVYAAAVVILRVLGRSDLQRLLKRPSVASPE
jgi:O-antigen/teichoic acid export membrane protein